MARNDATTKRIGILPFLIKVVVLHIPNSADKKTGGPDSIGLDCRDRYRSAGGLWWRVGRAACAPVWLCGVRSLHPGRRARTAFRAGGRDRASRGGAGG